MGVLKDIEHVVEEEGYDVLIKRLWVAGGDSWSVRIADTDSAKTSWTAQGKTLEETLERVLAKWHNE